MLLLLIVALLFVAVSPVALAEPNDQASIISTIMLFCVALCPMFLCLFVVYAGLIAALYYAGRANQGAASLLRKSHVISRDTTDRANEAADKANAWSIRLVTSFERVSPLLRIFDRPKDDNNTETDMEGDK